MVLFFAAYSISGQVADNGNYHTVDGSDTPMNQVSYNGTQNNADNRSPVDVLDLDIIGQILITVGDVTYNQDGADGR